MKVTKISLIEDVASETGYPVLVCYETIEQFLVSLCDMVAYAGNPASASGLQVRGFGRFDVVRRKGRTGRNFRAAGPCPIHPFFTLRWTPFPDLKRQIKAAGHARKILQDLYRGDGLAAIRNDTQGPRS